MPQHADPIRQVTRTRHRTKSCPFCAEDIRLEAIKCRYCGEFLYGGRRETAAKFGPADSKKDRKNLNQDAADRAAYDDVLWFGRPSVFALAGTIIKMGVLIALCWAVYRYPVTSLVTYVPEQNVSPELLAQIESYLDFGALGLLAAAVLALVWKVISIKSIYYEVTPDRIEWSRGIFDRQVDNIDMFRVIDLKLRRSLLECLLGIGTVTLTTKDDSDPHFDFVKVRQCRYLYDVIKEAGLEADKTRNVIHVE
jgi:membrane protein YdbS with pleckstrin-like domain